VSQGDADEINVAECKLKSQALNTKRSKERASNAGLFGFHVVGRLVEGNLLGRKRSAIRVRGGRGDHAAPPIRAAAAVARQAIG
jgi:hypothetical protein